MECYIGVDVGSRSVRSVVLGSDNDILAQFVVETSYRIDPIDSSYITASQTEVWNAVMKCISKSIASIKVPVSIQSIAVDATCSLVVERSDGSSQDCNSKYKANGDCDIVFWMDHRSKHTLIRPEVSELNGCFIPEMAIPKIKQIYDDFTRLGRDFNTLRFYDLHNWLEHRLVGTRLDKVKFNGRPVGIDGSLQGFSVEFLHECGIPLNGNQIGGLHGVPFVGQPIGYLRKDIAKLVGIDQSTKVVSGMIDCYASFFANGQPENTMVMIAGTSACCLVASRKPTSAPAGIWGGFRLVPGYEMYEGGFSCCGILLEKLAKKYSWDQLDAMARERGNPWLVNAHRFYSGDYLGNRTPYSDPKIAAYQVGLDMKGNDDVCEYILILEYIVLETWLIVESFIKAGFKLEQLVLCGSVSKNLLVMGLLKSVMDKQFGIRVVTPSGPAGTKVQGAYGMARVARMDSSGKGGFHDVDGCEDEDKVVKLMQIKYRFFVEMNELQTAYNKEIDEAIHK